MRSFVTMGESNQTNVLIVIFTTGKIEESIFQFPCSRLIERYNRGYFLANVHLTSINNGIQTTSK